MPLQAFHLYLLIFSFQGLTSLGPIKQCTIFISLLRFINTCHAHFTHQSIRYSHSLAQSLNKFLLNQFLNDLLVSLSFLPSFQLLLIIFIVLTYVLFQLFLLPFWIKLLLLLFLQLVPCFLRFLILAQALLPFNLLFDSIIQSEPYCSLNLHLFQLQYLLCHFHVEFELELEKLNQVLKLIHRFQLKHQ